MNVDGNEYDGMEELNPPDFEEEHMKAAAESIIPLTSFGNIDGEDIDDYTHLASSSNSS